MAFPSLRHPRRTAPDDGGSMRVTLADMLRADRATADFLWAQRGGSMPSLTLPSPSVDDNGAEIEQTPRVAHPPATLPLASGQPHAQRKEQRMQCPHCGGGVGIAFPDPAPRYVRSPLAPPSVRVLSFLQQDRDATATVRTVMRRLHFSKADLLAVLRDLERAGLGRLHVRRRRSAFSPRYYEALVFSLNARGRDPAVLLL
jgi:hypothetical protein